MRNLALLVLCALLLSACGLPTSSSTGPTATPDADAVATQVALMLLAQQATETSAPATDLPSPAPVEPSATLAPTSTTAPTATLTPAGPTETPLPPSATPSATADPNDPKASLGTPSWQTDFSAGSVFGTIDNDNTKIRRENGELLLTGVTANGWLGWSLTFSQKPKNAYLEYTFKTGACSGSDQYGIMFRAPDTDRGYFFGVTCGGQFSLRAADFPNDKDFYPLSRAASGAIKTGADQTNVLGLMIKDNRYILYANGQKMGEATDSTFSEAGYIGAFVQAYETPSFTVKLQKIQLWNLP